MATFDKEAQSVTRNLNQWGDERSRINETEDGMQRVGLFELQHTRIVEMRLNIAKKYCYDRQVGRNQ